MIPLYWKILAFMLFLLISFEILTIILTLLLADEVYSSGQLKHEVSAFKLRFVQVANWIYVGLFGIMFLVAMAYIPRWYHYREEFSHISDTGLKPAA